MACSARDAAAVEIDQRFRFDAVGGPFAFEEAVFADEVSAERGVAEQVVAVRIFDTDDGFMAVLAAGEGAGNLSERFVGSDGDFSIKCRNPAFPAFVGGDVQIF